MEEKSDSQSAQHLAPNHPALSGKWSLAVLQTMRITPMRLSSLRRAIPAASKKMLLDTLQGLIRADMVERFDLGGRVRHVEYRLHPGKAEAIGLMLDAYAMLLQEQK